MPPRARRPAPPAPEADVRARLSHAAIDLFGANGYEQTTVDQIATAAGVARRTFFRYFASKEDVIFPDHDRLLEAVRLRLDLATQEPITAVCTALRVVFDSYLDEPDVAVRRYQLIRTITVLRDRENASVSRYQRVLSGYLRDQLDGEPEAGLHADVAAAAVVAAHNHVLRRWLNREGTGDAHEELDRAVGFVLRRLAVGGTAGDGAAAATLSAGDLAVAVFPRSLLAASTTPTDLLDRLRRAATDAAD